MKDPSNYKDREAQKNEQVDIEITDDELVRPTMVSVNNTVNENAVNNERRNEKC